MSSTTRAPLTVVSPLAAIVIWVTLFSRNWMLPPVGRFMIVCAIAKQRIVPAAVKRQGKTIPVKPELQPALPKRMLPLFERRWRVALGAVVPMPTLVSAVAPLTPAMLPSTRLFDWLTFALAPIVVAFVKAGGTKSGAIAQPNILGA